MILAPIAALHCGWHIMTKCGEACRPEDEAGDRPTVVSSRSNRATSNSRVQVGSIAASVGDRIVVLGFNYNALSPASHSSVTWVLYGGSDPAPTFSELDEKISTQRGASVWISTALTEDISDETVRLTLAASNAELFIVYHVIRPEEDADLVVAAMTGDIVTNANAIDADYAAGEDNRLAVGGVITLRESITSNHSQTRLITQNGSNANVATDSRDAGTAAADVGWSWSTDANAAAVGVILRSVLPETTEHCLQVHECFLAAFEDWPTKTIAFYDSGHPLLPGSCWQIDPTAGPFRCNVPVSGGDFDELLDSCEADKCVFETECPELDFTVAIDISFPWSASTGGSGGCPSTISGTIRIHGTISTEPGMSDVEISITHNGCSCTNCDSGNCDEDYSADFTSNVGLGCQVIDGIAHWRLTVDFGLLATEHLLPAADCFAANYFPYGCSGTIYWTAPIPAGEDSPAGATLDHDPTHTEYDFECQDDAFPDIEPPGTVTIT